MKVALCTIGRKENLYAREFVEHHLNIGFDKIIIYDNNRANEERFIDVLKDYVEIGKVEIVPLHVDGYIMLETYKRCYEDYGKEYDWIMYLDFDEFLYVDEIHKFLQDKDAGCISISWELYGDCGLVHYDSRLLTERFTEPLKGSDGCSQTYRGNQHIKSIVKTKIPNVYWPDPHCPRGCGRYIYSNGIERKRSPFQWPVDYHFAKIKHYSTKTIEEWLTNKVKRGQVDCKQNDDSLRNNAIDRFFDVNIRTPEKEAFIKKLLG